MNKPRIIRGYTVVKTTTDKLEEVLDTIVNQDGDVKQISHVGGRDWVVIAYAEVEDYS